MIGRHAVTQADGQGRLNAQARQVPGHFTVTLISVPLYLGVSYNHIAA